MAGSKTRFGFRGGGDEPPDSEESPAARTIIGHDIHLQKVPSGFEPPRPLASPTPIPPPRVPYTPVRPAAVMAPMPEAITESVPVRRRYSPQKSRLAHFLGRWTAGGKFHSRSSLSQPTRLGDGQADAHEANYEEDYEDAYDVPRDTTGRNVLLVLVIAGLTFLVTFALVKIRQRYATPQPPASAKVAEPPVQAAPAPAPPTAPAPAAAPAPAVVPAPKPALLGTPVEAPAPKDNSRPPKPAQPAIPAAHPPEHLKGELMPLSR